MSETEETAHIPTDAELEKELLAVLNTVHPAHEGCSLHASLDQTVEVKFEVAEDRRQIVMDKLQAIRNGSTPKRELAKMLATRLITAGAHDDQEMFDVTAYTAIEEQEIAFYVIGYLTQGVLGITKDIYPAITDAGDRAHKLLDVLMKEVTLDETKMAEEALDDGVERAEAAEMMQDRLDEKEQQS